MSELRQCLSNGQLALGSISICAAPVRYFWRSAFFQSSAKEVFILTICDRFLVVMAAGRRVEDLFRLHVLCVHASVVGEVLLLERRQSSATSYLLWVSIAQEASAACLLEEQCEPSLFLWYTL